MVPSRFCPVFARSCSAQYLTCILPRSAENPTPFATLNSKAHEQRHAALAAPLRKREETMIFGLNLLQWITDRLTDALNALSGPIAAVLQKIS
jgi:hypothetical protein